MGPANANAGPFRRGDGYARRAPAGAYSAYSRRMPAGVEESTPAARCSSSRTSVARLAVVARRASRSIFRSADIFTLFYKTKCSLETGNWRGWIFSNSLDADRAIADADETAEGARTPGSPARQEGRSPRFFRAHRSVRSSALAALPAARPRRCRCHDVRFGASSRPLAGRSPSPRARSSTPRHPGGRGWRSREDPENRRDEARNRAPVL